jgi:predicted RNA-binding protein YlqC (UPF0109 family)
MSEQAQSANDVRLMIEKIAKSLVDSPDQVIVEQYEDAGEQVVELEVAETDLGKIIGRHGRTAKALRTLLSATGVRSNTRYDLEILE